jgi:outer membrane cobalamin receptor
MLLGIHPCVIAGEAADIPPLDTLRSLPDSIRSSAPDTAVAGPDGKRPANPPAALPDTVRHAGVPPFVGSLRGLPDSSFMMTKADIQWMDYCYLGGILQDFPGIYVRSQSSAGQYDQLNIRGSDWRSVAILMNGRPLNDPATGIYNPYHFSPEYADQVEAVTGVPAFLYGFNGTGGTIDLLTKNSENYTPYTKMRYSESAYNYEYSDGTFRQNISRRTNFSFGFQHQGTDGRFPNSAHDAWNFRLGLHHRLSDAFTIIASEYHTSTRTNLNGGADPTSARTLRAFDPLQSVERNTDSYEKTTRHDLDLTLVGTLFPDTTNLSTLTLYYSHNFREYRDEENRPFPNGVFIQSDHTTSWMGTRLTQNFRTDLQRVDVGASMEIRQVEGSPNMGRRRNLLVSAWAKEDWLLSDNLTLSGFTRFDHYRSSGHLGLGGEATVRLSDPLTAFAGFSLSRRLPTYQEEFWTDSTVSRPGPIRAEKHFHLEAGTRLRIGNALSVHVAAFHHRVVDAIRLTPFQGDFVFPGVTFSNTDWLETNGLEVRLRLRHGFLYLEGNGVYLAQKAAGYGEILDLPHLVASGGAYFWSSLFDNHLDLKAGFRGRYSSPQLGEEFNPEMLVYVTSADQQVGRCGTVDFVLIARLGDAYIHFIWENLTNAQCFSSPFFPVLDRAIRFGLAWEFFD